MYLYLHEKLPCGTHFSIQPPPLYHCHCCNYYYYYYNNYYYYSCFFVVEVSPITNHLNHLTLLIIYSLKAPSSYIY
jgi:hypothetical protein